MKSELRFGERICFLATLVVSEPLLVLIGIEGQGFQHYLRVQYMILGVVLTILSLIAMRGLWRIERQGKMLRTVLQISAKGGVEQDAVD